MYVSSAIYKDLEWSGKPVFDFSTVKKLVEKHNEAFYKKHRVTKKRKYRNVTKMMRSLKQRGMAQPIGNGLYALIPFKYIGKKEKFVADKFHIAQGLINKMGESKNYGRISHYSALELHGAASSVFNYVYITSEKPFQKFEYDDYVFKRVAPSVKSSLQYIQRRGGMTIQVTSPEETFVDCIEKPKYAGGLEEFSRSFFSLKGLDSLEVVDYTLKHHKVSLNAKVGFFLSILKRVDEKAEHPHDALFHIREESISRLHQHIKSKKVFYLEKGKNGHFVKEWNVIVPPYLYELYAGEAGGEY